MNVGLVLLTLVLFAVIGSVTGRIEVRAGQGWDGSEYAAMLEEGWAEGTANTALRPLVVALNRPAFLITGDVVAAFRLMNYAYVALLCLALCLLFDRYSADPGAKVLAIANVMLSIATLKYAAYYPVLIDAGAYAAIALAMYFVVSGWRIAAAAACVAAVLSREFAIGVLAFGIVRDLRTRAPLRATLMTYGPAAVVFAGWRMVVVSRFNDGNDQVVTAARLLTNMELWGDPVFIAFFAYFLVTVFGGVSLFVFGRLAQGLRLLGREPEWVFFAGAILVPALLGTADMWRYLVYLMPAFVVLFAVCARETGVPRPRLILALTICLATILTQRPLEAIDVSSYFSDWFPYYVHLERVPEEAGDPEIWPAWAWRFLLAAAFVWLFAAFPAAGGRTDADRA